MINLKIALLGPPGSGKGTVSERLAEEFKLFHLSAGELLREEVAKGTSIGKEIQKYIEKGRLVPAEFVVQLVKLEVADKKKYILDGFPRSLEQAKEIEDLKLDAVIYLDLSERLVIERLSGRRLDPITGKTYHLKYLPPPKGIEKRLTRRKDDQPSVIKERFKEYHKETEPVIEYYKKKKILKPVDASGTPEEVYSLVKKALKI
ncbi:MAG: nucleoside monophosphate kinase [Nanoarchaeota archaeon]